MKYISDKCKYTSGLAICIWRMVAMAVEHANAIVIYLYMYMCMMYACACVLCVR